MNAPDSQLQDFIEVYTSIIPSNVCDVIVDSLEKNNKWIPHTWYNAETNISYSRETKELEIQPSNPEQIELLNPFIVNSLNNYHQKFHSKGKNIENFIQKFSDIRFNRYSPGQFMRQHHDHIQSLFDGREKGIPVLSIILNLNEDYDGAELFFWDDHIVPLGKGDIVIFPSLFLFPHGVTEPTKGKRYSGVSWAW